MVQLNVYPLCDNDSHESGVYWYPDKNDTNSWNYGEFNKINDSTYTLTSNNEEYNFNSLHPYKYTHARNLKETDHSYVCKVTHLQS